MCIFCVTPPGTIPTRESLEKSARANPHGFGFAIAIPEEQRFIVQHSMKAENSISNYLRLRTKYMSGYSMWHARIATHGAVNKANCHPFQVGTDKLTYLAHNGILGTIDYEGETRSDTRVFAEDVLDKIGGAPALDNPQIANLIMDFTKGSKVAVLTLDPNAAEQCYLFHKSSGNIEESTKIWWSNTGYKSYDYSKYHGFQDDYNYHIPFNTKKNNIYSGNTTLSYDGYGNKYERLGYTDNKGKFTSYGDVGTIDDMPRTITEKGRKFYNEYHDGVQPTSSYTSNITTRLTMLDRPDITIEVPIEIASAYTEWCGACLNCDTPFDPDDLEAEIYNCKVCWSCLKCGTEFEDCTCLFLQNTFDFEDDDELASSVTSKPMTTIGHPKEEKKDLVIVNSKRLEVPNVISGGDSTERVPASIEANAHNAT